MSTGSDGKPDDDGAAVGAARGARVTTAPESSSCVSSRRRCSSGASRQVAAIRSARSQTPSASDSATPSRVAPNGSGPDSRATDTALPGVLARPDRRAASQRPPGPVRASTTSPAPAASTTSSPASAHSATRPARRHQKACPRLI